MSAQKKKKQKPQTITTFIYIYIYYRMAVTYGWQSVTQPKPNHFN